MFSLFIERELRAISRCTSQKRRIRDCGGAAAPPYSDRRFFLKKAYESATVAFNFRKGSGKIDSMNATVQTNQGPAAGSLREPGPIANRREQLTTARQSRSRRGWRMEDRGWKMPHPVRAALNGRWQEGQRGKKRVGRLNGWAAVQRVLAEEFAGQPVNQPEATKSMNDDWTGRGSVRLWPKLSSPTPPSPCLRKSLITFHKSLITICKWLMTRMIKVDQGGSRSMKVKKQLYL